VGAVDFIFYWRRTKLRFKCLIKGLIWQTIIRREIRIDLNELLGRQVLAYSGERDRSFRGS
jgi:hypothetical protein